MKNSYSNSINWQIMNSLLITNYFLITQKNVYISLKKLNQYISSSLKSKFAMFAYCLYISKI